MKSQPSPRRHGFTILELLIILAVLGILISLLAPVVEHTRETSRRASCQNNLRQIGLALHSYHETFGRFPAGATLDRRAPKFRVDGNDEAYSWSWSAQMLPWLGLEHYAQQVHAGEWKVAVVMNDPALAPIIGQRLAVWRCPSDNGPDVQPLNSVDPPNKKNLFGAPLSNYPAAYGHIAFGERGQTERESGSFYCDSRTSLADLSDGAAQTILVGERHWEVAETRWWAANVLGIRAADTIYGGTACWFNLRAKINEHAARGIPREQGLASNHPGGVQILMADGAVRFLQQSVQHNPTPAVDSVLERLVARADGQPVGEF